MTSQGLSIVLNPLGKLCSARGGARIYLGLGIFLQTIHTGPTFCEPPLPPLGSRDLYIDNVVSPFMHPYSPWAPSVHTHRPNAQITQPPCRSAKLRVTQAQNRSSDRDTRLCCSTYCVTPLGARLASDWPRLAAAIAVSKCERSSHELISAFAATAVPSDQPSEEKALINRAGIAMQTRSAIKKSNPSGIRK